MKRLMLFTLALLLPASATAQQQETAPVPPISRTAGWDLYPLHSEASDDAPSQRPNDLQILTSRAETSVPAAERAAERYGYAPYFSYSDPMVAGGYSAFHRRSHIPLFGPHVNAFPTGFVPRQRPFRPFFVR